MKHLVAIVLFAACGSKQPAPATPAPATTTAAAATSDDLCAVVDKVIAAAPQKFAGVDAKPGDAKSAGVEKGPINTAWTASWAGNAPTRLDDMKKRVLACDFAKHLVGDGNPHATEKDGAPDAIDWTIPAKKVSIEVIAEGAEGTQLSIVAQ